MVGIQPPSSSSSSSRIRSRPPPSASASSASASPQRHRTPTPVANNNNNAPPPRSSGVPLESVVVRNTNNVYDKSSKLSSSPHRHHNKDDDSNNSNGKSTNVKVCVRLRPMLSSDYKNNAMDDNNNSNHAASTSGGGMQNATPSSKGGSKGFARETASSNRHQTPRKRHASGLTTPAKNNAASTAEQQQHEQQHEQQHDQQQNIQPSWQTHPSNTQRITQATYTTTHTSHHNPERLADYSFDRVYAPGEPTKMLYDESIRGVVSSFVEGFHGSVFAYGQTNSGKTHTMTGSRNESGVVRLAVQDIFDRITSSNASREYLVRVSYLEIYNEQIYDLLLPPQQPSKFKSSLQHHHLPPSTAVRIFESRTEGVVVRGLREEIVTCPEDVFALLDSGDAKRKVGSTGMNKTSSRSHSVFRLVMESRGSSSSSASSKNGVPPLVSSSNSSVNSDTTDSVATGRSSVAIRGPVRISSLSLVDLAGSESVKATGSTGVRQKEGQYINKSLLTLGHVVHKLSEMSTREQSASASGSMAPPPPKEHIPYRDSKLTRLLQPSLGGNAQVCIICNISPALGNLEESHNTLKFAMRAKKIQQHARITEVADEKTLLRSYREEIEELKRQLQEAKVAAAEAAMESQQVQVQVVPQQTPRHNRGYSSSSDDEEDQDDAHVLVSAIANLESLILKAGAKSTRKAIQNDSSNNSIATGDEGTIDESSLLPSRALDAALMKAESSQSPSDALISSPGAMSTTTPNKSSLTTPTTRQDGHHAAEDDEDNDHHLLEELHRIQGMLGTVMKKKRKGVGGTKSTPSGSNAAEQRTPERDAEVERLRLQLQEQAVTSTMRKADSSFLQSQLNEKQGILKEVSVLLEALEKRQLQLESENKQLREDLAEAANMIEEGDASRKLLEQMLAEKDEQLSEKKDIVFVEHSG
eukprot:CAMPEP_0172317754 /NCGR_PEP_ID=MMETSP1058-20130122/32642_1 /TAXON_ID=83371 /ORGANISM="Detonula confervacea, Strain CCMP 353" /LENGTH=924 /DNA_ID=CAMNT_0013032383 /DNA_START=62 /DNA_END=2836 /DNA_ORIENTATION=+